MTKRVAVYARYSSNLQKETSIEDQIAMAKRFCAREGWSIVEVFTDEEKTGRNTRRPGFQAMKAKASAQSFDIVLVEAVDRLTRNVKDALSIYDFLAFQDIELHSIQEGKQDFMKALLTGFGAQMFSENIGDHTRRGLQGAITRKRVHRIPYGYRRLKTKEGLNAEIDAEQARVVRRIFEEYSTGKSPMAIAQGLNEDGIPSRSGKAWDKNTILGNNVRGEGMLRNRLYIGTVSICRTTQIYHPAPYLQQQETDLAQADRDARVRCASQCVPIARIDRGFRCGPSKGTREAGRC